MKKSYQILIDKIDLTILLKLLLKAYCGFGAQRLQKNCHPAGRRTHIQITFDINSI